MSTLTLTPNKRLTLVVGGVALASLALLAYTLTRPTKEKRHSSKRRKSGTKVGKFTKKYDKKPIECHLVMSDELGFNAHVAADKKNKLDLKYGARLISINGRRVEDHTYEEIFNLLTKAKLPITLKFREFPELEQQWLVSEVLKDEANVLYRKGEIAAGVAKVTEAIALHNTNKTYYSNRVLMYLKSQEYELALVDCQKIRELDPKSVFIKGHYLRGLVLFNLHKYKNATSAFQTVIKLNPNFKQARIRLDECMHLLENENKEHKKRRSSEHEELKKALLNLSVDNDTVVEKVQIMNVTPMESKASTEVKVKAVDTSEIKDESISELLQKQMVVENEVREEVVVETVAEVYVSEVDGVNEDVSNSKSVVNVEKADEESVVSAEENVQIEEISVDVVSEENVADVEVVVKSEVDVEDVVKYEVDVEIKEDEDVNEVEKEVEVVKVGGNVNGNVEEEVEDTIVNISKIVEDVNGKLNMDENDDGNEENVDGIEENAAVVESTVVSSMNSSSISIEAYMEK